MSKRSRFQLSCVIAALLSSTVVHADARFRILAVKHNPTCGRPGSPHFGERCGVDSECDSAPGQGDGLCIGGIIPTNTLNVLPGDTIVAEVYVSDWSPNGESFRTYQVQFDLGSFFDDCPGGLGLHGWDPRDWCNIYCFEGCTEIEVCSTHGCVPRDQFPETGLFIEEYRLDWAFNGFPGVIHAIEPCTLTFGATLIQPPGPVYDGTPKYLASIVLSVLPDAAGEHEVSFLGEDRFGNYQTFVRDSGGDYLTPFNLQPLTLVAPGIRPYCWDCPPIDVRPAHCAIDARQPYEPDGSLRHGSNSLALSFPFPEEDPCYARPEVDDFTVRQYPNLDGDAPPAISSVDWDDVTKTATINYDRRISTQEWTCVTFTGREPHVEFCTGYLPGDVDGDGSSNATDILNVIDNLNGLVDPPYAIWQCDVDRSGVCSASDILRVIDLLNGADQYDIWLGATIDTCPDPWWRE